MMLEKVGKFEGVTIYESSFIKKGHAITLAPLGIFIAHDIFNLQKDSFLIKHEFGHILQYRKLGFLRFYILIGIPSLYSAIKASIITNYHHQTAKVEVEANLYAYHYFNQPLDWPQHRFPIK
jgi:hypothetical protein